MDAEVNMSQQRALVAQKAHGPLGCFSRWREEILTLHATGEAVCECSVMAWALQYKRDVGGLEGAQ